MVPFLLKKLQIIPNQVAGSLQMMWQGQPWQYWCYNVQFHGRGDEVVTQVVMVGLYSDATWREVK
jgi:hypothetical protein